MRIYIYALSAFGTVNMHIFVKTFLYTILHMQVFILDLEEQIPQHFKHYPWKIQALWRQHNKAFQQKRNEYTFYFKLDLHKEKLTTAQVHACHAYQPSHTYLSQPQKWRRAALLADCEAGEWGGQRGREWRRWWIPGVSLPPLSALLCGAGLGWMGDWEKNKIGIVKMTTCS